MGVGGDGSWKVGELVVEGDVSGKVGGGGSLEVASRLEAPLKRRADPLAWKLP